jgi:guanylate kinase
MTGKAVIISAPSGAGKTTIVKHLLGIKSLRLAFSVSACTRSLRAGEVDGRDYHFMTVDRFKTLIEEGAFLEWEEVYKNNYYGTLRSEVERIWKTGHHVLFDVDVMGGINLKSRFGENALAVFVMPPSIEVLQKRLLERGTESAEKLQNRINKAAHELKFVRKFDLTLLNDNLSEALSEAEQLVKQFLQNPA